MCYINFGFKVSTISTLLFLNRVLFCSLVFYPRLSKVNKQFDLTQKFRFLTIGISYISLLKLVFENNFIFL